MTLAALEEENCHLSQVKVNKMSRLVSYVAAKVASNDAMPGWVVLFVKLLLDECGNVLLNIVLLQRLSCTVHSILLHLLGHVRVLNDGLSLAHLDSLILLDHEQVCE